MFNDNEITTIITLLACIFYVGKGNIIQCRRIGRIWIHTYYYNVFHYHRGQNSVIHAFDLYDFGRDKSCLYYVTKRFKRFNFLFTSYIETVVQETKLYVR